MTKIEKAILISTAMNRHMSNKELRYGQCLFNVALKMFPIEANKLRVSSNDCFYLDQNAEKFLDKLDSLTTK